MSVVSVLFARFHFKVIRKSLYQYIIKRKAYENQLVNALIFFKFSAIKEKCGNSSGEFEWGYWGLKDQGKIQGACPEFISNTLVLREVVIRGYTKHKNV